LHVFLFDSIQFFLHNGKFGLGIRLLEGYPLSSLLSLDSLLRKALLEVGNHLLLVCLGVLGEFVHEITHSLDFRLGVVEQLLILSLQGVQVQHELSLFLLKLEVLLPKLIQLLIELNI
jgi:hypothetical protein